MHYKGILDEWIFRKLILEMKEYELQATFDMDILNKINEFLMKWLMKYVKFYKQTLSCDAFVATNNLILNKSKLKDYIMDKLIYYGNFANVPIFCQIGNDYYITKDKEYFPREFFYQLRLTFPLFILKQILCNEDFDIGNNVDYALLSIVMGTFLELLIYMIFNNANKNFKEITLEHTTKCIKRLDKLLLRNNENNNEINKFKIKNKELDGNIVLQKSHNIN